MPLNGYKSMGPVLPIITNHLHAFHDFYSTTFVPVDLKPTIAGKW